jgi:transposase
VRVEEVAWARAGSRFTLAFEEMVAYLVQITDKTTVTRLMGISWSAIGGIVDRVVTERLEVTRFDGLRSIGIDEFSYRRRHHYVTVVMDHDRQRVIWAGRGRGAATLHRFFDLLGDERLKEIRLVTIDMAGGYKKAIAERLAHAEVIYDRFHVAALASRAVDDVRRDEVRKATGEKARFLKGSRYPLLRNPGTLSDRSRAKLQRVREANQRISRAYELKEWLAEILDMDDVQEARSFLTDWLAWAQRSKLKPFVKLGRTVRAHFEGILAYVRTLHTNARIEGFNNRLRMIARRAFGFHSHRPLVAMLFLCCGGIEVKPPLPTHSK